MKRLKNIDALERFTQAKDASISRIIWIAANIESNQLEDIVSDMDESDFTRCFPWITISEPKFKDHFDDKKRLCGLIIDHDKYGLLAAVDFPQCDNFVFKNGKPISWSCNPGICRIGYVYAEDREGLLKEIEKYADEIFIEYQIEFKKKNSKNN